MSGIYIEIPDKEIGAKIPLFSKKDGEAEAKNTGFRCKVGATMREIDEDIWDILRFKQVDAGVLLRKAEISTLVKRAVLRAVLKHILAKYIQRAIRKEIKRYLWLQDHNQRVREFKRRKRWSAV